MVVRVRVLKFSGDTYAHVADLTGRLREIADEHRAMAVAIAERGPHDGGPGDCGFDVDTRVAIWLAGADRVANLADALDFEILTAGLADPAD